MTLARCRVSFNFSKGSSWTLSTRTNRCAAASAGAAFPDWSSNYYGGTKAVADAYLGNSPVDAPDLYLQASIIPHVKRAKTPTLIQHGEVDQNVPLSAAHLLRQLLVDAGVRTEMIVYAGAGHNPGSPRRLLTATEHNLWWFNHHIFGDPPPNFVAPLAGVAPQ